MPPLGWERAFILQKWAAFERVDLRGRELRVMAGDQVEQVCDFGW